jgi:hypothetical protein
LHCGGSPDALALLKESTIFDVNQFFWDKYFWRDDNRDAPHNLYTSSERWQDLFADYPAKLQPTTWTGWKFSHDGSAPASSSTVSAIKIAYNNYYEVDWRYDVTAKRYVRYVNGQLFKDLDGRMITADNILIQKVQTSVIDEDGRREVTTVGNGEARVAELGSFVYGTWKKDSPSDRTVFYDGSGQEIKLTPGQTWVEVVPNEVGVGITM